MKKPLHILALISIILLSFPTATYGQAQKCYTEEDDGNGTKTEVPCAPGAQVESPTNKTVDTNAQSPYGEVTSGPAADKFVPLTDIPNLTEGVSDPDLGVFLDNLYRICIGIAVVLAVLQLIRAGITYSMSDAITSKEEAKHLMLASILGLVLVLSPAIVFGIINPRILDLKINVGGLKLDPSSFSANPALNPLGTDDAKTGDRFIACDVNSCENAVQQCASLPGGGDADHMCKNIESGKITDTNGWNGQKCSTGNTNVIRCTPTTATSRQCTSNEYSSCPELTCMNNTTLNLACVQNGRQIPATLVGAEGAQTEKCEVGTIMVIQCTR